MKLVLFLIFVGLLGSACQQTSTLKPTLQTPAPTAHQQPASPTTSPSEPKQPSPNHSDVPYTPGEYPLPASKHEGINPEVTRMIQKTMRDAKERFKECTTKRLTKDPNLKLTVPPRIWFRIVMDGSVDDAKVISDDPKLNACIERTLRALKFDPLTKGNIEIRYPFR